MLSIQSVPPFVLTPEFKRAIEADTLERRLVFAAVNPGYSKQVQKTHTYGLIALAVAFSILTLGFGIIWVKKIETVLLDYQREVADRINHAVRRGKFIQKWVKVTQKEIRYRTIGKMITEAKSILKDDFSLRACREFPSLLGLQMEYRKRTLSSLRTEVEKRFNKETSDPQFSECLKRIYGPLHTYLQALKL